MLGPDGTPGYDLWVGGGLSTNPMFAQRLGVFVRPDEVAEVWAGVCAIFRDYGYRRSRNHARLKFLVADWGPEKFRQVLQDRIPAPRAARRPAAPTVARAPRPRRADPAARTAGSRSAPPPRPAGPAAARSAELAKLAEAHRQRPGPDHRPAGPGGARRRPGERPRRWPTNSDELGLSARPSAFHRGTIACTGIEFCKLALVETKGRAEAIRTELERRLPDFDTPITINVNGCPNSCARFQVADIGFKGIVQKVRQPDGSFVDAEAFQVHLGGQLGAEAAFGRKFRGLKVTAAEAADYAERILTGYRQRRTDGRVVRQLRQPGRRGVAADRRPRAASE